MKDSENKFKILIFLRGFFSKAFEAFISFLEKYWVWIRRENMVIIRQIIHT